MRPSTLDTRAGQTRCPSTPHRHVHGQMTCARCGVTDGTVAQTINRDGVPWPATCSGCSAVIREKSARIAAVERAVARGDTGERCDGSGTTPEPRATTTAGRALITRLHVEEQEASARADQDEMHSHARVAAKAERDLLRRLLRWVPDEVVRAEREAVEADRSEDERMTRVLEGVA